MADGRHLGNTQTRLSQQFLDRFEKNGLPRDIRYTRVTKAQNCTFVIIQDGGCHLGFGFLCLISVANEDIRVKFKVHRTRVLYVAHNLTSCKIQDGLAAILYLNVWPYINR